MVGDTGARASGAVESSSVPGRLRPGTRVSSAGGTPLDDPAVAGPRVGSRPMRLRASRVRWSAGLLALCVSACRDQTPPHAPPPRFSIIDIHTHLGGVDTWPGKQPNFDELTRTMNEMHVELVVDFKAPDNSLRNGVFGDRVSERLALYPDTARFKLFANVPIDDANNEFVADQRADYPAWVAGVLEDAIRRGAAGLKIKDQAGAGNGVDYWTRDRN